MKSVPSPLLRREEGYSGILPRRSCSEVREGQHLSGCFALRPCFGCGDDPSLGALCAFRRSGSIEACRLGHGEEHVALRDFALVSGQSRTLKCKAKTWTCSPSEAR